MGEVVKNGRGCGWGKLEQNFKINHVNQEKKKKTLTLFQEPVRSYL